MRLLLSVFQEEHATAVFTNEAVFCLQGKKPGKKATLHNEARPKERSDRGRLLPLGQKSLFIMRQGRESEATEAVFAFRAKKPFHNEAVFCLESKRASSYRGAYGVPLFN